MAQMKVSQVISHAQGFQVANSMAGSQRIWGIPEVGISLLM